MRTLLIGLWLSLPISLTAQKVEPPNDLCLAANIYFEARGETLVGQLAVRDATLNRGSAVCVNVFAKRQFSWTHKMKWVKVEGFLTDNPKGLNSKDKAAWETAKQVVKIPERVLNEDYKHYHALNVRPDWSGSGVVIGNHKFLKGVK